MGGGVETGLVIHSAKGLTLPHSTQPVTLY